MNNSFLSLLFAQYAPVMAILAYVGGVYMLVKSMRTQDQHTSDQAAVIIQLRELVGDCIKAQIASHDQMENLHERCTRLSARQQLVEKRGPDAQRIDMAMRMLKRGTGDLKTLADLGLSNSEIKLLMRLHSVPTVASQLSIEKPRPIAVQGQVLARLLEETAATG